ncbi:MULTISPECIES: ABC transporter substrate-binding protein [Bradyrhizobium]|uniref:ABC transporter substrate-binding protein n=1 Tax=Bradyrhizobium centrosematis TaxID=1300039 RepID=UPI00216A81AD|nr:ABC transporter substrate-binding protein [Bradyrhizobium centrosematis]MCS3765633.1 putative spermidine/putrescine transport system substrate-binding protein [Bradyrhizobium centrosematis]MCS3778167.1 putative spermidine/putrescine transport system substrate-binding protein [Bradyrhizobium centrosematis]
MTSDIHNSQKPTRRKALLEIGAAAGGAALVIGSPRILRAQESSLVVVSSGGVYEDALRKAVIEPFQRETGIKVTYASPPNAAKLKAQVDAGNVEWDALELSSPAFRPDAAKYLEEIDYDAFDKETLDNLVPEAKMKFAAGSFAYSTVMGFSTAEYPAGKPRPSTWAEFWDASKFPGARSLQSCARGGTSAIEFALLASGVPKDKLYPIDFEKAFTSLNQIRPHVTKFWVEGTEATQLLSDRQVAMSSGYNGNLQAHASDGTGVNYRWDEAQLSPLHWVVPKGTKNRAAAMRFVAYQATAQAQARLNSLMFYGPLNRAAFQYIDPKAVGLLSTAPANLEKQFFTNLAFWGGQSTSGKSNTEVLIERWTKWLVN